MQSVTSTNFNNQSFNNAQYQAQQNLRAKPSESAAKSYPEANQVVTPEVQNNIQNHVYDQAQTSKQEFQSQVQTVWQANVAKSQRESTQAAVDAYMTSAHGESYESSDNSSQNPMSLTQSFMEYQQKQLSAKSENWKSNDDFLSIQPVGNQNKMASYQQVATQANESYLNIQA